jgi:tripartite-type tricarboxylate transporter receptor subunit TctC
MPEVKAKLAEMEFDVIASSPEQFSDWIRAEIPRWGKVIRETGTRAN